MALTLIIFNAIIMNTNCLIKKIATARGILQPTILQAILNLYQRGIIQMSACEVKEECYRLDNTKDWNGRLPAMCHAMRNAIECDGRIVGEDRDHNEFTITF